MRILATCSEWVISGNAQTVQMISGLPRQADMIARTWHVRLVPKADSPGARYEW
jgi:hypothetical protein